MMKDVQTRADLEYFLEKFYGDVLADASISYIFTDEAKIDLRSHLPKIADFWEHLILGTATYSKNLLQIHLDLNQKSGLSAAHFQTWLSLFNKSLDQNFAGENVEIMKTRALSIATLMQLKIGNTTISTKSAHYKNGSHLG